MATMGWAVVLPVCEQPMNSLPSDTRLHRLLVSILDIHLQVEPALQVELPLHVHPQLQDGSMEGPTMLLHRVPPGHRYWEWVSHAQRIVLATTATDPLEPWLELPLEAVALFRYPARYTTQYIPSCGASQWARATGS